MKQKPTFIIYINNTIALFYQVLLRNIVPNCKDGNNLLLINTGQIGDLTISTVLINNIIRDKRFKNKVYFLIKKEYFELYNYYSPDIKILNWDYKKYKFNPIYRIVFLTQ
ncbi:MAG TPA: hypothetical protein PK397_01080, partial [Ignavibacteriaceae bacterium]|nr:hypothetical protein [Ignavibacteriaceae bacterium]